MRKKAIIIGIFLLTGIFVWKCSLADSKKGGENSMTIFDVDSDCLTVTINGENIIYKGEQREKIIEVLKRISDGEEIENDSSIAYDIFIDFGNGNTAKLSSEGKVLDLGWSKKVISQKDMADIQKCIEKN